MEDVNPSAGEWPVYVDAAASTSTLEVGFLALLQELALLVVGWIKSKVFITWKLLHEYVDVRLQI